MEYRDINDLIKEGIIKDLNIPKLYCPHLDLSSLAGIEKFTNLKELI